MGKSKAIGTAAESAVVKAAEAVGIPARRVVLAGAKDEGDVHLYDGRVVIEVKSSGANGQVKSPSWAQLRKWMNEAVIECVHAKGELPVLVVKRVGSGKATDWYAYLRNDDLSIYMGRDTLPPGTNGTIISVRFGDLLNILNDYEGRRK